MQVTRSTMRQLKPHSLSYQEATLAACSFSMSVSDASTIGVGVVEELRGHRRLAGHGQDAAQRSGGRFFKRRVDCIRVRGSLKFDGQVDNGDVLDGHSEGHACSTLTTGTRQWWCSFPSR